MSTSIIHKDDKFYSRLILVLAIAIPLVVALLFGIRTKVDLGTWTKALPHLNGILNSATAILLLTALSAVKRRQLILHERLMTAALIIGSIFLVSYVLYHFTNAGTHYGGDGILKTLYYFLLISHIILAGVVVPFVLYSVYYSWSGQLDKHKKVVKWSYPVWLYVSVSGVVVYLMISPYYV